MEIARAIEAVFGLLVVWRLHTFKVVVVLKVEQTGHELDDSLSAMTLLRVKVVVAMTVKRIALGAGNDLAREARVLTLGLPLALHEDCVVQFLFFAVLNRTLVSQVDIPVSDWSQTSALPLTHLNDLARLMNVVLSHF